MKKFISFLKLAWQVSPGYLILLIVQGVAAAAKLWFNLILPKFLVDELLGERNMQAILFFGILIVANNVGMTWLDKFLRRFLEGKENYLRNEMNKKMAEKILNLEYSYLEEPYYLDLKERAVFAINNQDAIANLVSRISEVFGGMLSMAGVLVILATLGPVMIAVLLAAVLAMLLLYKSMSAKVVEVMSNIIPYNRKYGYYFNLHIDKQYQKDIRLFDMGDMISDRTNTYVAEVCDRMEELNVKEGKSFGGVSIVNDAVAAICYVYVGLRTISSRFGSQISIGSLTMYVSAAIQFTGSVFTLGEGIITTKQVFSFLDPYMEFMALAEETAETGKPLFEGPVETVAFSHVTFTYPKAEKPVLTDVSFTIQKGEKISIVGLNGAGKSTLVKLLCRMYRADSGEITVNGKNIYDYDYMSYMKTIAAVFQDYRLFNFSIAENISCQEAGADEARIQRLIDEVGLREKINGLKNGIESRFGKEYDEDGIEMSGGEGQKIAIARALYKDASLVILDEPASALDPIAEAEIYEKFNGLVEDKTAIYISHRMSSSVFCDNILILDGGTVADFDTHEHLMQKTDSLYYRLFMSQAENYRFSESFSDTASA